MKHHGRAPDYLRPRTDYFAQNRPLYVLTTAPHHYHDFRRLEIENAFILSNFSWPHDTHRSHYGLSHVRISMGILIHNSLLDAYELISIGFSMLQEGRL
jgi:hypothetical protein